MNHSCKKTTKLKLSPTIATPPLIASNKAFILNAFAIIGSNWNGNSINRKFSQVTNLITMVACALEVNA